MKMDSLGASNLPQLPNNLFNNEIQVHTIQQILWLFKFIFCERETFTDLLTTLQYILYYDITHI